MPLPVRYPVVAPRSRGIARASAGLSALRLAAAGALLLSSGSLYVLSTAREFLIDPTAVQMRGLNHTTEQQVREVVGLGEEARPNLFRVRTEAMEAALREVPAVVDAEVRAWLPDRLSIEIRERTPILVLQRAGVRYLVDAEGVIFAGADRPSGDDPETDEPSAASGLPLVNDDRVGLPSPVLGERLAKEDLEVARILGAVSPELLGSSAPRITLRIDDLEGYVLAAGDTGWRAVFGHYTPHLRSTALIEGQVQCLRAVLASGESRIETVYLSPSEDRCGTFRTVASSRGGERSPAPFGDEVPGAARP